jgi:broad specificity phosphatase PhoE
MRLVLVRHGESVSNREGRWQGQGDAQLSDRGRAQAEALGRRLGSEPFDRILSSDLSRAADTAAALGRPVDTDPIWRELHLGRWEGLTRVEVAERWPEEVAALARGEDIAVGGGESWGDLGRRVEGALAALRAETPDEHRVLLVAHGGVIITLLSQLLGLGAERPRRLGKLANTAISEVDFADERSRILRFNDTRHSDDAATWRDELDKGRNVFELRVGGEAMPPPLLEQAIAAYVHDEPGARRIIDLDAGSAQAWASITARRPGARAVFGPLSAGGRAIAVARGADRCLAGWNVA